MRRAACRSAYEISRQPEKSPPGGLGKPGYGFLKKDRHFRNEDDGFSGVPALRIARTTLSEERRRAGSLKTGLDSSPGVREAKKRAGKRKKRLGRHKSHGDSKSGVRPEKNVSGR